MGKRIMHKIKRRENNRITYFLLVVLSFMMVAMITIALVYYSRQMADVKQLGREQTSSGEYTQHYVMIVDDSTQEFWQSVYEGASERAADKGILLELMGEALSTKHSVSEYMEMAIAEQVDGIMLASDGSEGISELIGDAAAKGIPVVTMLKDEADSKRVSHVGISYYNLGQQYAEQLATVIRNKTVPSKMRFNVLVLMNNDINDSSRNIVYSTIRDVLDSRTDLKADVTIESRLLENTTSFAAEESIRSLFVTEKKLPDIIVCLDEICSACVSQALVDYNQVGKIELIGYYTGATILSGISKKVIYSTTGVDTRSMGMSGVDALSEYLETGYTSDYYSVDTFVVNQDSIAGYMGGSDN